MYKRQTFDQLKVTELAAFEVVARQLQLLEERVYETRRPTVPTPKAKAAANSAGAAASATESGCFSGSGLSKANLCIAPKLLEYVADQMKAEAAVAKERRKAREERALRAS